MRYLLIVLLLLSAKLLTAQTSELRFSKYPVDNSGVDVYLPSEPDPVTLEYSPDSSKVYTIECVDSTTNSYFHFGALVVNMKEAVTTDEMEDILIQYLDYLKGAFEIASSAGYGKGHTLDSHPGAQGVIDYWKDKGGDEWRITGWATETTIVVMFEYGPKDYPNSNLVDAFMKGVRFPGD